MIKKAIPAREMPSTADLPCKAENAPFVDVFRYSDGRIAVDMQYARQGRDGAITTAYLRRPVADRLLCALEALPKGYTFLILDAWRPYEVQKSLYDEYYDRLKAEDPTLGEAALHRLARQFVSFPDRHATFSYVHASGGAVDLTLLDAEGNWLDMGTAFDDFSSRAYAAALEKTNEIKVRDNRRLLYYAMTEAGFTSYPYEWWHYDFGDIFYGALTGQTVKYASVYDVADMLLEDRVWQNV